MERNLDRRVDAVVPIEDPEARARIDALLAVMLADDRRSWQLGGDGVYHRTEEINGAVGSIDTFETLKAAALEMAESAAAPHRPWSDFLTDLEPRHGDGGWHNTANPLITPVQAQQWQALLKGLRAVAASAATAGLTLPEPLHAWAEWIIPVGRLSFPTGRIVSSLDRLEPLPPQGQLGSKDNQQPLVPQTEHQKDQPEPSSRPRGRGRSRGLVRGWRLGCRRASRVS